jgi:hypothetical protein
VTVERIRPTGTVARAITGMATAPEEPEEPEEPDQGE